MFKHLTIKTRNLLLALVVLIGLATVHFTAQFFNDQEKKLLALRSDVELIDTSILTLRKQEKDFFARNELSYEQLR